MRDFEPDDIPRHVKRASQKRKCFGVECHSKWFKKWLPWKWYLTEEQRDQALAMLIKHVSGVYRRPGATEPQYRKVERK